MKSGISMEASIINPYLFYLPGAIGGVGTLSEIAITLDNL